MEKSRLRIILTILIIFIIAAFIFYPKLKPLFGKDRSGGPAFRGRMGGGQALSVSGS